MSARTTIERILRDDDDASGQTIRRWKIEIDGGHITLSSGDRAPFVMLRPADMAALFSDLRRAITAAHEQSASTAMEADSK